MLKVIIVEDEDMIRNGLCYSINWMEHGFSVVGAAKDGLQGLEMIDSLKPDLVITDIMMPKMNGIEMLRIASGKEHFKSIVLTCYSEFDYAKKAIELHVFDYLLKPIDEDKLGSILGKIRKDLEHEKRYGKLVELAKNNTVQELSDWDIYCNEDANRDIYVKEVLKRIDQNYRQKLIIEKIADDLGISVSFLSRRIKECTGRTFLDLLNRQRIHKAIKLLNARAYKIYEISELVGFSEYKYFCSVFKKYVGVSPTKFLKSSEYAMVNKK